MKNTTTGPRRRLTCAAASCRWIVPTLLATAMIMDSASLGAQAPSGIVFGADVGVISYRISEDRADAFEQILARVLDAMSRPAPDDAPRPALTLRLLRGGVEQGSRLYVLWAEPIVRGADYSLDTLIQQFFAPQDAAPLRSALRAATNNAAPIVADLQSLRSVSPQDALRSRIEQQLGPLAGGQPFNAERERDRLAQVQKPLWAVEDLRYDVTDTRGSSSRVRWSGVLRNVSLVPQAFRGTLTVQFRSRDGAVVAASDTMPVVLGPDDQLPIAGELTISNELLDRIAQIVASVNISR